MLSRWLCVYPVTLAGSSHLQIPLSSTVMGLLARVDEPEVWGVVFVITMGSFVVVLLEMSRVGWRFWVLNWLQFGRVSGSMSAAGFSRFTVASDSQQAMTILQGREECWTNLGNVVEDVR
ncbi:hypothetical protein GBA52_009925 [Prunus armeniaca]|nr:hypothetical protein GBA52_009925 [Prunus armeniaca]